jgi:hypothetical protein
MKWRSRRAVQIRLLLGIGLLGWIGWLYYTHYLVQMFALLGAAIVLVLMSLEICRVCGLPWMIQPLGLWRGACSRCENQLP